MRYLSCINNDCLHIVWYHQGGGNSLDGRPGSFSAERAEEIPKDGNLMYRSEAGNLKPYVTLKKGSEREQENPENGVSGIKKNSLEKMGDSTPFYF